MYIVYNIETTAIVKPYDTLRGAKIAMSRSKNGRYLAVTTKEDYFKNIQGSKTKIVKNLMTGQDIVIDAATPHCCDPSTETYWSM